MCLMACKIGPQIWSHHNLVMSEQILILSHIYIRFLLNGFQSSVTNYWQNLPLLSVRVCISTTYSTHATSSPLHGCPWEHTTSHIRTKHVTQTRGIHNPNMRFAVVSSLAQYPPFSRRHCFGTVNSSVQDIHAEPLSFSCCNIDSLKCVCIVPSHGVAIHNWGHQAHLTYRLLFVIKFYFP